MFEFPPKEILGEQRLYSFSSWASQSPAQHRERQRAGIQNTQVNESEKRKSEMK